MAQAKRRDLDWFTVKYKDIYAVIGTIILIIAMAGGGFWYWRAYGNPESKAVRAMAKAKALIDNLDKPDAPPDQKAQIQSARSTYSVADAEMKQKNYNKAFSIARDLIASLDELKTKIELTTQPAVLQDPTGQVEVKKLGQHLFSSGSENQALQSGDIVKTGKDGYCKIKYHNGTINLVNPDTLMVIQISMTPQGGSRVAANVEQGKVEMKTSEDQKANEESIIATPQAKVTGAAATRVEVSQNQVTGQSKAVVMEGQTVIESPQGQKQTVAAGNAVVASSGGLGITQSMVAPPSALAPKDGEVIRAADPTRQQVYLEWEGSGQVRVQLSGKPLFSQLLGKEQLVSGGRLLVDGLPAGIYYWRMRAAGPEDKTYWSKIYKFRMMQKFNAPKIKRELKLEVETTPIGDGVILQGSVDPGISVSANDLEIPVNADGSFSKIVLFGDPGVHQIMVRAFDDQGNEKIYIIKKPMSPLQ